MKILPICLIYRIFLLSSNSEHLEEVSTAERIDLVKADAVRRWGQIIMSFVFVTGMIAYLGWYLVYHADDEFRNMVAIGMYTLFAMAVGAALAIFGLGRTVGRK